MKAPRYYRYYRILMVAITPIALLYLLRELLSSRCSQHALDRLGYTPARKVDVWIHCASVGEVNAVAPLIKSLSDRGKTIHLSTFTASGRAQAQRRFGHDAQISYSLLALDWRSCVRRQLSRVESDEIWLVETEIWPTLIVEAERLNRTIRLINGRLSRKTLSSPRFWRTLLGDLLNYSLSQRLLRSESDETMFRKLGVTAPTLLCGNLKRCDTWPSDFSPLHSRPYILLASSHPNEEIELAQEWAKQPHLPDLVMVPRHPHRRKIILSQFKDVDLPVHQRSIHPEKPSRERFLLADTFGELPAWMAHAELVIMGGTVTPKGGQNPLEAIYFEKVVLCGPDMRDFEEEARDLTQLGVLHQSPNWPQLIEKAGQLLSNPNTLREEGIRGAQWLAEERETILKRVLDALDEEKFSAV